MATAREYWIQRRSADRLASSERIGVSGIREILNVYDDLLRSVNEQITDLYSKYAKESGLAVDELVMVLNGTEKANFIKGLRQSMARLGMDVRSVYNINYINQLTRLEAFKEQIYWQILSISENEKQISSKVYRDVLTNSYRNIQTDLAFVGVNPPFFTMSNEVVLQALSSRWAGSNYSNRIWKNSKFFAGKVKGILARGLALGEGNDKIARSIRERFDVSKYVATRLARTETNYFHNEAEAIAYEDDGVDRYMFEAKLDGRTSTICEEHDNKVYRVSERETGVNFPPMHPNCRSTTIPVLDLEESN